MGTIGDFFIERAKKIEKKRSEKITKFKEERSSKYKELQKEKEKASDIIWENIVEPVIAKMEIAGCHLKKGDSVILNKYNIDYDSHNGWDTGVYAILNHVDQKNLVEPIYAMITDVSVDIALCRELVDNFLEVMGETVSMKRVGELERIFRARHKASHSLGKETFGLFYGANFKLPKRFTNFSPSWGLNVNSFLRKGTPGADLTDLLWRTDETFKENINIWREKEKKFTKVSEEILSTYKAGADTKKLKEEMLSIQFPNR